MKIKELIDFHDGSKLIKKFFPLNDNLFDVMIQRFFPNFIKLRNEVGGKKNLICSPKVH